MIEEREIDRWIDPVKWVLYQSVEVKNELWVVTKECDFTYK